jgi:predicted P-loop ATPase
VDYGRIRAEFQRRGFKPIAAEIARTAVAMVADENTFDSAHDYVASLLWDGVPRIDAALPTYFRTADTPYARAVGAYLFTALAGRALQPGVQADMVPVLVGLQGERKSSSVRALSPHGDFFAEVNLKKIDDDNTARLIRGKLVGEIAELRGLFGRDQESIKAWITRRVEQWRSLYNEFVTSYPRRIVFIGTTNEREFLDDPSGERRWLPIVAGKVDVESLERDREQLWAEGAVRFRASGVAWQDAERLARGQHEAFKLLDPWQEPIEAWLAQPHGPGGRPRGSVPFKRADVAHGALHKLDTMLTPPEQKRLAKVLGMLGYESGSHRVAGEVVRAWARRVPTPPSE